MVANKGRSGSGSLVRDARGVAIHHLVMGWSIYSEHSVVHVLKSDPRGDGRPPRHLADVRVPIGFLALVGMPSMDAALTLARALVESLARATDSGLAQPPAPPEGATGAVLKGTVDNPLPGL